MENILSLSMVFLIVVIALGLVIAMGMPIVRNAGETADTRNAQSDLMFIDRYVQTVAAEGKDAVRIYKFSSPKKFESIPGEDVIGFSAEAQTNIFDYLTRSRSGTFTFVGGNNVNCYEAEENGNTYLVLENDKIKAFFRKTTGQVDTGEIMTKIIQKTNGADVYVGNSSVIIDDNPSTSVGTGFTELSFAGKQLPACQVHASVNSTTSYDVYYRLYAGADFLEIDVRNIG